MEIGIMVSSEAFSKSMADGFDHITERLAFRLELQADEGGFEFISWQGVENDKKRVWQADPHTSLWQCFVISVLGLLPM